VYKIENSAKNKVLRRGHTDTFKFVTKPLGAVREVIVGHHPKPEQKKYEKEQSWYLHEVVVKNTDNGERSVINYFHFFTKYACSMTDASFCSVNHVDYHSTGTISGSLMVAIVKVQSVLGYNGSR
jgi:hypothetical protein